VLAISDELRELISGRASEQAIRKAAVRGGMRSLLDDGIDKSAQGLTTLAEVLRVVSHGDPSGRIVVDAPAPVAIPLPDPIPASHPLAAAVGGDPGDEAPVALAGRVLVVEDSPTIVSVVKYFLELEGFDVLVAENGLLGLQIALRECPDVIVSDVMMPGMGGLDMVRALRADPRMAAVRILMLTSEESVESETEGLAAGADDYILKPVEPRRLAARVKALRARSRLTPA